MLPFPPLTDLDHRILRSAPSQIELSKKSILRFGGLDAIVSPTVSSLKPSEGIAKDIYETMGEDYHSFCHNEKLLFTSKTSFYNTSLPAIIHVVPPSYTKSEKDPLALENAYFNVLELAKEHEILSIGIPPLERKRGEYPMHKSVPIAYLSIAKWLLLYPDYPLSVVFCVDDQKEYAYYRSFYSKFLLR